MSKDDDYDDYSDDFVSDEEDAKGRRSNTKKPTYGIRISNKSYSKGKGRGKTKGGQTSQRPSPRVDNVAQRMLSASRIKMNELRNQLDDHVHIVKDLREENKLLKKMQYRQERALGKFEDQESDLPRLILKHNNEIRTYKDQLRNAKDKYEKTDRYLRDAEDDLERATTKLKKYKSLVDNKGLLERDELNRKLSKTERDCEEKDSKINELQRHIDHLTKNHRHELGVEIARHRETKRQLEHIRENVENTENKLREKEKELEIKNIYSNRVMRPPHKLPASYSGTPLDSPPPGGRKRIPSIAEMTSREKAKMFELRRREEMKKKQAGKSRPRNEKPIEAFTSNQNSLDEERNRLYLAEQERREEEDRYLKQQEEENARARHRLHEQERERARDLEKQRERAQREREEDDFRRERDRMKRESEELETRRKREKEDRERRDREDRERREREDREKRERDDRNRIEREERERRDQYEKQKEMEEKAREEKERLANDPREQEERRKKDLLLARLKALDNGEKENVSPINRSPFDEDGSTPSSKKSYSFSKPVENLHSGKPAYEEVSVPYLERRRQSKKDEEIAGYNPSFGGRHGSGTGSTKGDGLTSSPSRKPRKAALMDELFGGSTSAKKDDDFLFGTPEKKPTNKRQSGGFQWEDSKPVDIGSRNRENSSTLFGGGAALIEDDSSNDKTKLLPRRSRHQSSTFSSKPAVTAVDTFEDDIEEVML